MRVIVVGAGVAGLTASHCLQKANIDHVVLERGVVAPHEGASIAIYPHGCRILAQIGALDAAKKACTPMNRWKSRRADGKVIMDNGFFHHVKENHGQDILMLERREFLEILYNTLPDRSRIQTGRKVVEVVETAEGVEVSMADGTVEKGSIILGCDGVNSRIRELMWEHANKVDPGSIVVQDKTAIKTTWKAIIGVSTRSPELGENEMTVVHNSKYSFLALTQPDKVFWFVFFKQTAPSSWPRRVRYSEADCAQLAESVGDHAISDTMVFGELYSRRIRSTLIPIEEGVLGRWWHGRTVLAGDATHKVTPNIALGGNSTMESIVVLCNHLNRLAKRQQGVPPSRAKFAHAFTAYQAERKSRMKEIMQYSSLITRLQAKDGLIFDFAAHYVSPILPDSLIANDLGRLIRAAPKLDFVNVPASFGRGSVPWADEENEQLVMLPQPVSPAPTASSDREGKAREVNGSRRATGKTAGELLKNGLSSELQALGAVGALSSVFYFMAFTH